MSEAATIEPVVKEAPEYVPPQVPDTPKPKVNRGDIFRKSLDTALKAERGEKEEPKDDTTAHRTEPDTNKADVVPPPTEKQETEETPVVPDSGKPQSPLDVVISDKKPEVKPEPDVLDELESVASPKSEDWKKLKSIAKTHRDEKKALEATVEELKKTPKSDPEEITRLAAERDALKQSLAEREQMISAIDVRLSKDYQDTLKSRDKRISKVASTAKAYGADVDALVGALNLPDGTFKTQQIKAALAEVEPEDRTDIRLLIGEVNGLNEKLQELETNAPTVAAELNAKREAALREQQEASIKNIHSEFGRITETLPTDIVTLREVPEDVPGGTEWNQAIKNARENALRILSPGGSDFNESATVAVKGAHYDALMTMFLNDHKELVDARKRLAEYDGGGPDFKGSGKPAEIKKVGPKGAAGYYQALDSIKGSSSQDD